MNKYDEESDKYVVYNLCESVAIYSIRPKWYEEVKSSWKCGRDYSRLYAKSEPSKKPKSNWLNNFDRCCKRKKVQKLKDEQKIKEGEGYREFGANKAGKFDEDDAYKRNG